MGFKAPLAYSSSFYFIARKDGMERKYMMYEGEDTNSIDLLYEKPTEEPNGVKVIVPVNYSDRYSFVSKIKEQLAYFENVYFDVQFPSNNYVNNNFTIHRAEHFQYSSLDANSDLHLCLDNVYYPIDWDKLGISRINVPIALRFSLTDGLFPTPNREAIRYTQEAKTTILNKIKLVANVFMEKFNDSICDKSSINSIIEFYNDVRYVIPSFYTNEGGRLDITDFVKYSSIPIKKPKLKGVELLDLEKLTRNRQYILGEYRVKFRCQSGRFNKTTNMFQSSITISSINDSNNNVYIYSDKLTKSKQDYIRSLIGNSYHNYLFVKKEASFELRKGGLVDYSKYYHSILNLSKYPKSQWRQLIKEFRHVIDLYVSKFIDVDAIDIPQTFIDAQKAKRAKPITVSTTVNGVKKVRMKGEFSGKIATKTEVTLSNQYSKFVPKTFKLEDAHKVSKLHVYGSEQEKPKLDKAWSCFKQDVNFVIVAQSTIDNLKKANLHNWITIDKFMEGKNRPFRTMATQFLVEKMIDNYNYTFKRIAIVEEISKDFASKLELLKKFDVNNSSRYCDQRTKEIVLQLALDQNLFDQEILVVYKQVEEVFNKLTFLNPLMGQMGYKITDDLKKAFIDLFKYNKQKVNLEHYSIKLNEDAPLEGSLTEKTVQQLQTV